MMAAPDLRWCWLPDDQPPYLLECWLRSQPADAAVALLVAPERAEAVRSLAAQFPVVRHLIPATPGKRLSEMPADHPPTTLIIPYAVATVPMRYREVLMPEIPPHYGLLRRAWQWGFREIYFAGPSGGHSVPVPHLLDAFHNRHAGQRCFVVGNGPSLNAIDMTRLKDEITFGSNRCFLGYESWGFPFTYWGVYDTYQIETYHQEYEAAVPAETVKFFPAEYLPILNVANGCPVNCQWPPGRRAFSPDPDRTYVGFTVTYMLLQIAACMGCDPIILVGADHRYALGKRRYSRRLRDARRMLARQLRGGRIYNAAVAAHRAWRVSSRGGAPGAPALWSTEDAAGATHFSADYTAGGKNRFLPPEPEEAARDFDCAREWAEASGRQILNATPDSALESFARVDYTSLF